MSKEEKAYAFVLDLANRFKEDIEAMKAGKEPMGFPGDALNHMVNILTDVSAIMDED